MNQSKAKTKSKRSSASDKPTLRLFHNLARSGGTLVSKCLGCMKDTLLLSEIHPQGHSFIHPVKQAHEWYDLLTRNDFELLKQKKYGGFDGAIRLIATRCGERRQHLLIRDWSHLDFIAVPFLPEPCFKFSLAEALQPHFNLQQIALVRHPIDQWLSLSKLGVMQGHLTFERYLTGYQEFARRAVQTGFVRYEDFTADPVAQTKLICEKLQLPFDRSFIFNWHNFHKITGDVKQRSRGSQIGKIRPLSRQDVSPALLEQFRADPRYRETLEWLGYQDVETTSSSPTTPSPATPPTTPSASAIPKATPSPLPTAPTSTGPSSATPVSTTVNNTGRPKDLIAVLYSGLCNRMFVLLSAMRVAERAGHRITAFWPERTGRYGLKFVGPQESKWEDFFRPLPNVSLISMTGSIHFQDPIALDQERLFPENLPTVNGQKAMTQEMAQFVFGPKRVDETQDRIIVQKMTKPFGMTGDPMEKYVNYIEPIGTHSKDAYLSDLSRLAKTLVPQPINLIEEQAKAFQSFPAVWGIQIRGTDLKQKTNVNRRQKIIEIIQSAPAEVGFFVASDEPISWLTAQFPQRILSFEHPHKTENSNRGSQLGLVDLYLLARCQRLFGTGGSSFSMMAWLLSDLSEYTIHS